MALINKDQVKAEIRRLIGIHSTEVSDREKRGVSPIDSENDTSMALIGQCHQLLGFLDTLPEQPVIKKSNALFDKCVENCDPAVMKEVSDNIDKMLGRQPVEGQEEAACEYVEELEKKMEAETGSSFDDDVAYLLTRLFIAGAEWQKEKDVAKFSASLDKNMKHVVSSNYKRGGKDSFGGIPKARPRGR